MARSLEAVGPGGRAAEPSLLFPLLSSAALEVRRALGGMRAADRRRPGSRPGQYLLDQVADKAVVAALLEGGLFVLSEESGISDPPEARRQPGSLLAVVDPVDGSTNAALGIPWYATSVCVLDSAGPLVALVVNQASGTVFEAVRGGGARCDGEPITPSGSTSLASAVVGVSGLPAQDPGWAQFRALGAASLDVCAVAAGHLDAYRVAGSSRLHVWDYLAAVLVAREAGGVAEELDGQDLVVRDASPRRPVVAATPQLLAQVAAAEL